MHPPDMNQHVLSFIPCLTASRKINLQNFQPDFNKIRCNIQSGTVYASKTAMKRPFEPIKLPRKNPSAKESYRVYSDAANFKLVEAANAAEALKASGLTEARRIERYTPKLQAVLESGIFSAVAADPVTLAAPAAATEPATAKSPENTAPLSSEEVSKLLQENPPSPTASA